MSEVESMKTRQRQGLGRLLLVVARKKFVEVFDSVGGIVLFVEAKDMDAKGIRALRICFPAG